MARSQRGVVVHRQPRHTTQRRHGGEMHCQALPLPCLVPGHRVARPLATYRQWQGARYVHCQVLL